ncbi:hypothetical protein ACFV6E_37805 [Streptomyces sp. NPDC059785]|uniref:hypothetical protein n=1 Tax=unclassified Streptomyces TaxID=2593676 RepID=UPI003664FA06
MADVRAVVEDLSTGTLLRAPIGDFLLVDGEIVDLALYEAALTAVRGTARRPPSTTGICPGGSTCDGARRW